ncbi:MAG: hypothetical protein ACLU4N_08160 [Butyricimonas faecihominis]
MAILIFSWEKWSDLRKSGNIGRIATRQKKSLHGVLFIPVFIGNVFAGIISGVVYQNMADKVMITRQFVAEKGLHLPDGLSNNAYFDHVAQQVNLTPHELTNLLWNEYSPSDIWMVILAIGLGTTLLLYIYDRVINKTKR